MNDKELWEAIQNKNLDTLGEMVKESLEENKDVSRTDDTQRPA